MRIFENMKLIFENEKLKKDLKQLETLQIATETRLDEKNKDYRRLLADKEELKDKLNLIDLSLRNANKTIDEIIGVAQSNGYGNNKNKLQKIIELAKNRNNTSPIK